MLDYGFEAKRAGGTSLTSEAASPRPAADMKDWRCGKSYPGFSVALKSAAPSMEVAVPSLKPAEAHPESIATPARHSIRRF
jgi:hypothetical protein